MGKQGPCTHCGIERTPLWRKGPPEKPVLCNACGSRYRTRGTLVDYIPKHAGGFTKDSQKLQKSKLAVKENLERTSVAALGESSAKTENSTKSFDTKTGFEDAMIDSSTSGSAISSLNGGVEISDPVQSIKWDPCIISRKRSPTEYRELSTVEKLQMDLYNVMQQDQGFFDEEEEPLIHSKVADWSSNDEIGLGIVLLKPSSPSGKRNTRK